MIWRRTPAANQNPLGISSYTTRKTKCTCFSRLYCQCPKGGSFPGAFPLACEFRYEKTNYSRDGVKSGGLVVAADRDLNRIKRANDLIGIYGTKFVNCDVAESCFRENSFDLIILHHVLEHVDNDKAALRDCFRMLKEGGALILGVPNEGAIMGRISRALHKRLYEKGEHVNFYSERDIVRGITDFGFKINEIYRVGFLFPVYYLHMLLISNPVTFRIGNFFTQLFKITADSLLIIAKKPVQIGTLRCR